MTAAPVWKQIDCLSRSRAFGFRRPKVGFGFTPDGGAGAMIVVALTDDDAIECHFRAEWVRELSRYKEGDQLKVTGKIDHYTGAHLLVLTQAEIAK